MPKTRTRSAPEDENAFQPIADRLVQLRKRKGWSQVEIAEKLGLSRDLVASIESGRTNINSNTVIRWAAVLEVSTDHLLGVDAKENQDGVFIHEKSLSIKLMRRMLEIAQLPPAKQAVLLKTIDLFLIGSRYEHLTGIPTKVESVENLDAVKASGAKSGTLRKAGDGLPSK
jgi:transcriptional regulator with XRE-family HTH domain